MRFGSTGQQKSLPVGDGDPEETGVEAAIETEDAFALDDVHDSLVGRLDAYESATNTRNEHTPFARSWFQLQRVWTRR